MNRVIYGLDEDLYSWQDAKIRLKSWEDAYAKDWRFFSTAEMVVFQNRTVQGLALPEPVLRKIFHDNAMRWVPGLAWPMDQHSRKVAASSHL